MRVRRRPGASRGRGASRRVGVRRSPDGSRCPGASRRSPASQYLIGVGCVVLAGTVALAGCSTAKPKAASTVRDCGTSRTAANVPVVVEIRNGTVACSTAMTVAKSYAQAVDAGKAPGNGGGGPVSVQGWTCQGFNTPEVLKTGDVSKCAKNGTEILEILKTTST